MNSSRRYSNACACARRREQTQQRPAGATPPRVLIVDDEEIGTEARLAVLRSLGFDAEMSNSGYEAIARADIRSFDVIVLDYDMPLLNGIETARHLKNIGVRANLVMLSGRMECPWNDDGLIDVFVSKGQGVPLLKSAILMGLASHL
jgi:CheY-like chemotaxis protein